MQAEKTNLKNLSWKEQDELMRSLGNRRSAQNRYATGST